jgi:hypothetical protein
MSARSTRFWMQLDNAPLGRSTACATLLLASALCAQAAPVEIYRCGGTPAIYTSDLRLVRTGRCTRIGAAPAATRTPAAAAVAAGSAERPAASAPPAREATAVTAISRDVQQARDSDRVHILQTERARERDRLALLTQQLQQLQSTPQDVSSAKQAETASLSQAIQRSESDLQALDKELARAQR